MALAVCEDSEGFQQKQKQNHYMRVYLSLPITGYNEKERRSFAGRASGILMATHEDWMIVNPFNVADHVRRGKLEDGNFDEPTYDEFMAADIKELQQCEKAIFCSGWERSKGCKEEYAECLRRGIDIGFLAEDCESVMWQSKIDLSAEE